MNKQTLQNKEQSIMVNASTHNNTEIMIVTQITQPLLPSR